MEVEVEDSEEDSDSHSFDNDILGGIIEAHGYDNLDNDDISNVSDNNKYDISTFAKDKNKTDCIDQENVDDILMVPRDVALSNEYEEADDNSIVSHLFPPTNQ